MKKIFSYLVLFIFIVGCQNNPATTETSSNETSAPKAMESMETVMSRLKANSTGPTAGDDIKKVAMIITSNGAQSEMADQMEAFKSIFADEATMTTTLDQVINNSRNTIYNQKTNSFDRVAAKSYIAICELFAALLPQNASSPKYLFQAGETARSIGDYQKALSIYDNVYVNFKSYEKSPQALFLKAFTLDNDMKQPEQARAVYEEFVAKHPNDDFADDTKFLLENLGKSDEEIIKRFEK